MKSRVTAALVAILALVPAAATAAPTNPIGVNFYVPVEGRNFPTCSGAERVYTGLWIQGNQPNNPLHFTTFETLCDGYWSANYEWAPGAYPGALDIWIKPANWLAYYVHVDCPNNWCPGIVQLGVIPERPAGDGNNDNVVGIIDYNMVRSALGSCNGDPAYNQAVDWKYEPDQAYPACVNTQDYTLMWSHWNTMGAILPYCGWQCPPPPPGR